jgi:hypothetical protein
MQAMTATVQYDEYYHLKYKYPIKHLNKLLKKLGDLDENKQWKKGFLHRL